MIRQRNPVALADLTRLSPRTHPHRRRSRRSRDILAQHGVQKLRQVRGVGDQAVDGERVGDGDGDRGGEVVEGCAGERRAVFFA